MSKKKTKSRYEKATVKHDFSHLEKIVVSSNRVVARHVTDNQPKSVATSIQDIFIKKDLRFTGLLLTAFIAMIGIAGIFAYYTHLLTPVFKLIGISY